MAAVVNGKVVRGAGTTAGEFGHDLTTLTRYLMDGDTAGMTMTDDVSMPLPVPDARRAGAAARIAAGVGGALALLIATLFTGGFALPAPLGGAISRVIVRGRGRRPTLFTSWLGAVAAVGVAVVIVFGMLATRTDLVAEVRQSVDSAMAANRASPSPLSPGAARAIATYAGGAGLLMVALIMGTLAGSVGWLASWPLAFAITGRWREPTPVEPLPPEI